MTLPSFFRELQKYPLKAQDFIASQEATVLHEVAHLCAANEAAPIAGHLIFATDGTLAGGFIPAPSEREAWSKKNQEFTIAAAIVAEMHFCGRTDARRAHVDLNRYEDTDLLHQRRDAELQNAVLQWKVTFGRRVAALEDRIAATFENCKSALGSDQSPIGSYHVIPSGRLPTAFADPGWADHHLRLTDSFAARSLALDEVLREMDRTPLHPMERLKGWWRVAISNRR